VPGAIGDDMRSTRIVMTTSTDGGKLWSPKQYLTPIAHSVAVGIYDRNAKV